MANYELNSDKMFADVTDGIAIIINSETGIYYGMNGLGTVVYENLVNGVSAEKILAALKSLDGAPDTLEDNFNTFIKALIDNELVIEAASSDNEANIDIAIAKEDNFELKVKEYDDAQELLLADPIHEVKEETGWTPEKDSLNENKEDVERRESKMEE